MSAEGVLAGKAAIVTGASQGVGRGIALALASEGAAVTIMARTESKLAEVAVEIDARGGRVATAAGDVKQTDDIERCVQACLDAFGRIDVLVNNAQEVPLG